MVIEREDSERYELLDSLICDEAIEHGEQEQCDIYKSPASDRREETSQESLRVMADRLEERDTRSSEAVEKRHSDGK